MEVYTERRQTARRQQDIDAVRIIAEMREAIEGLERSQEVRGQHMKELEAEAFERGWEARKRFEESGRSWRSPLVQEMDGHDQAVSDGEV